jgi:hypothetical protein
VVFSLTLTKRKNKLPTFARDVRKELEPVADADAHAVLNAARRNIADMGAYDTGAMSRSGHVTGSGLTRRVVFDVEYALYVHEGHHTRSGSFVAGRPFLSKAADETRRGLDGAMREAVERAAG